MKKAIIYLMVFLIVSSIVSAINYEFIYNPYTGKRDRTITLNQSGNNLTIDNLFGLANNSDKLDGIDSLQFLRSDINDTLEAYYLYPNGTNPIFLDHLVNKEFVELAVAGLSLDYFFTNETSDISEHYVLSDSDRGAPESIIQSVSLSSGTDQLIFNFSTSDGLPFIFLSEGIYDAHIHLDKTGGVPQTIVPKWILYKRNSSGEFLLMTSETSNEEITASKQVFDLHSVFNDDIPIVDTDRLVFKLFVDITGAGLSTVRLYMEGTTDSHFTFRTTTSTLDNIFLRRDGRNPLKGNWDAGSYNITANTFYGNLDWTNLTNYPVACPSQSYITQLDDSVTCTSAENAHNSTSWNRSGTNVSLANSGDKVGIGTSTPSHKLNVVGNTNLSGDVLVEGNFEVSGSSDFYGTIKSYGAAIYYDMVRLRDSIPLYFGSANDAEIKYNQSTQNLEIDTNRGAGGGILDIKHSVLIEEDLDVTRNITSGAIQADNGYTGDCVNTTFVGGIAISCND